MRRQMEEPLSSECREYPLDADALFVAMIDTPYYPPYVSDAEHIHNCIEIGLCLAGSGTVSLRGIVHAYDSGSIIVVPRSVHHNQHNSGVPMTHWLYVVVNEDNLLRRLTHIAPEINRQTIESALHTPLFLSDGESCAQAAAIIRLLFSLWRRGMAENSLQMELGLVLLLSLFASVSEDSSFPPGLPADPHIPQSVDPALLYISEHYRKEIRVSDLARSCSMSESYFRKVFLRQMGQSPLEYLNRYRIHRAVNLLRTTGESMQNIAERSGFTSIAAFNRNFKQSMGVSPSAWRREHRR